LIFSHALDGPERYGAFSLIGKLDEHIAGGQFRGLVSAGFASREFLTSRLISRRVTSSVYVGEKVSDFTQPMRSAAGKFDQFLVSSSRVRCSLARQLFTLSLGVWLNATEPAARQLAVRSQLGTPSATAARVRRAEASVGQNEMPSAEAAAMAIINRRNMTADIARVTEKKKGCHRGDERQP
jgi:hypothetical protein